MSVLATENSGPPVLVDLLTRRAQTFHLMLSDIVKACEHHVQPMAIHVEKKKGFFEALLSSMKSEDNNSHTIAENANEFLNEAKKSERFSIHFSFSPKMRECTGRTQRNAKGYIVSVAYDDNKQVNKKEQLKLRFTVAHELGHIMLHDFGKDEFDSSPTNKPSEGLSETQENEANIFAVNMLQSNNEWWCPITGTVQNASRDEILETLSSMEKSRTNS